MPFQHLDTDAKAVVSLSNAIAHEQGLEYVGTEHILLALLQYDHGTAAKTLQKLGVDEDAVRAEVDAITQSAKEDTWVFGRLPGSPHYRRVIELAIDEATQLEATKISSEHLLLALLREKGSAAERALASLNVTLERARAIVLKELHKRPS